MKRAAITCVGLIALLVPWTAHADPIGITVLNTSYTAAIDFGYPYTLVSVPSETPTTELTILDGLAHAAARSDWLTVATSSRSLYNGGSQGGAIGAASVATFDLTFATVTEGIGTISLQAVPCGFVYDNYCDEDRGMSHGPYSQGSATLFDVTTNEQIWRYSLVRHCCGGFSYPDAGIAENFNQAHGPYLVDTIFAADHIYTLHLTVSGDSYQDSTQLGIQVSGLVPVPEPSSLFLLGIGLATLGMFRRRVVRRG